MISTFSRPARLFALLACLSAAPVHAADAINIAQTTIVNSPDFRTYPATARITSVTFNATGFPVEFNRRTGPSRWPDQLTPGWDGPLQYTLGMCLQRPTWVCSSVVEFWYGRELAATAAPTQIAAEWFYDPRWGALYQQQPAVGESVVLFVISGDGRNAQVPVTVKERSEFILVQWGTDWTADTEPPTPSVPPTLPTLPSTSDDSRLRAVEAYAAQLQHALVALTADIASARDAQQRINQQSSDAVQRIDTYLSSKPIPKNCRASLFGFAMSCALEFEP